MESYNNNLLYYIEDYSVLKLFFDSLTGIVSTFSEIILHRERFAIAVKI